MATSSSSSSSISSAEESEALAAAEAMENDARVEEQWAEMAYKHAQTYERILGAFPDPRRLRLTPNDDDIYEQFRAKFPHMRVDRIDEDAMKSLEGKELWRPFLMSLETLVVDYNFATLLRLDSRRDYSPENTTVVPRAQFYCIEIARNREGANTRT